ncbi:TnsA-like heteromeric transposase endonuclease subunit [Streptomyces coryli]|uniref:TnsA-like heteromeric transposase endonuclease subunit n=1 Tax=Streptomyces coryli TaxID=1128680 RepID=UPI0030B8B5D4
MEYVDGLGRVVRSALSACWDVRFEECRPSRSFPAYRGQKNFTGWWWTATTGTDVGYESWLERSVLIGLDFDPAVVGISSQPFWLHWHDGRRLRRHPPDYFVRRADGSAVVVDVRADERIREKDAEAFAATAEACGRVGWDFARIGCPAAVREANLRWLAGYRHPRCMRPEIAARLREVFAVPGPLRAGAEAVGPPLAVLPVLFHLLWRQQLAVDVDAALLGSETVVGPAAGDIR